MGEDDKLIESMNKKRFERSQDAQENRKIKSKEASNVDDKEVLEQEAQNTMKTILIE